MANYIFSAGHLPSTPPIPRWQQRSLASNTGLDKYHPIRFLQMEWKSFMDVYNSIFESNVHKINQNCGNLPETFWVDKFLHNFVEISTEICGILSGISTSFHELKFSSEYFGSLFYWEYFLRIFCFVEIYSLISMKRSSKFSTTSPK